MRHVVLVLVTVAVMVMLGPLTGGSDETFVLPPAADKPIDFDRDIAPILGPRCLSCHGPLKQESMYRLDSREEAIEGGVNGGPLVPGNSAESLLVWLMMGPWIRIGSISWKAQFPRILDRVRGSCSFRMG